MWVLVRTATARRFLTSTHNTVLTSTHNLCVEQKYEKYQNFLSENLQFLEVKFSIYLNRHVLVMVSHELQRGKWTFEQVCPAKMRIRQHLGTP